MGKTQIVAILNVTPDSFSDGGRTLERLASILESQVDVIDIGAESTRPDAHPISPEEEIDRLKDIVPTVRSMASSKVSLDSRHYETIKHFIDHIDIINDVSGFNDERLQRLAIEHDKTVVLMHSLSVPVKRGETIGKGLDPVAYLQEWFDRRLKGLMRAGFKSERLIFDPGLGFGLDAEQSLEVIRRMEELELRGVKLMMGHSRKSFLACFGEKDASKRDPETHALTFHLATRGVDYVRVHDFQGARRVINVAGVIASE
jgi:dihydropteroate synthase